MEKVKFIATLYNNVLHTHVGQRFLRTMTPCIQGSPPEIFIYPIGNSGKTPTI